MGRKTYESMDYKPLKQRENIIISSNKNFKLEEEEKYSNVRVLTIEEIEKEIKENTELVYFIIGGAQLYENFIDSADKLYLTHVKDMSKGDEKVRFPRFNANNYKINNIFTGIELDRNNNSNCIIDIKEYIKTKNFNMNTLSIILLILLIIAIGVIFYLLHSLKKKKQLIINITNNNKGIEIKKS